MIVLFAGCLVDRVEFEEDEFSDGAADSGGDTDGTGDDTGDDPGDDTGTRATDARDILATEADFQLIGEEPNDQACISTGVGDLDDDGYGDLLVGARGSDRGATGGGAVYIVRGPLSGSVDLATISDVIVGEVEHGEMGLALAGGTDMDGDGRPDLVVAAAGADSVYLFSGSTTGAAGAAEAFATVRPTRDGEYFGYHLDAPGDVDGDGHDDLLVASNQAAWLFAGPISGDLTTSAAGATFESDGENAQDVVAPGDLDGDGERDFVVSHSDDLVDGANIGTGRVWNGPVEGTLDPTDADALIVGDDADFEIARTGDVDGDGYDDLLVGIDYNDLGETDAGAAFLFRGPVAGEVDADDAAASLLGSDDIDQAGSTVSGAGDVDGDGLPDLLVGAHDSADGICYLVLAPVSGTMELADADLIVRAADEGDTLGEVSAGGDIDGDGFADVLFGAWNEGTGGGRAGSVYGVNGR